MLFELLASVGMTNIIVNASIFDKERNYIFSHTSDRVRSLLSCMLCTGFWSGMLFGIALNIDPIMFALSTSALSEVYGTLISFVNNYNEYIDGANYIETQASMSESEV